MNVDLNDLLRAADGALRQKTWRQTARPAQLPPDGDWSTWLILSGRGFGKTRTGIEWVHEIAQADPWARIALVGATASDARKILIFGPSGVMTTAVPGFRPEWHASDLSVTWPNGARADLYSAEEPDRLRGGNWSHGYCDEFAAWPKPEAMDNLRMGLRLGRHPRLVITTTPRPLPHIRSLLTEYGLVVTRGKTWDNAANLPDAFIQQMRRKYEGTRMGKQELEGEILDEAGALWTAERLNASRRLKAPELLACAVGVDPSAGSAEGNDEQGITAVGMDAEGELFVLEDATVKLSPAGWGHAAVAAALRCTPTATVVIERNCGGDMAVHVVRTAAEQANVMNLQVEEVIAKHGKHVRAEPISALWEQSRGHLCGHFEDLEKELLGFTAQGYAGKDSPNRADAMIWACHALLKTSMGAIALPRGTAKGIVLDELDVRTLPDAPLTSG